ncbi:uncharacterized protein EDB91DRAFT_1249316 [Suillus paluster]|uniref:uncharacterized protein n=1 Tax=Suillus paluster TaxID=48578 RepID=UPI001B865C77|nr:uncharacterized protein EDB91DRAFT_1249316 [Suillus paluster]KAG1738397.1 hypothetical protein EDB91DRAFT_1249316 [Suillus paluster]
MSSETPQDLWLERSRLAGMILGAVSYGGFSILTAQAATALTQKPRRGGKIADHRFALISYVLITFVLATIGFAANAKYTQTIWIDLRDSTPGGPIALIVNEMDYPINVVAIARQVPSFTHLILPVLTVPSSYFVMEWFMQALLLHRCFVIWNWTRYVMVPMITLYVAMIVTSILVLIQSSTGAVWYNINTELIYLCLEVGLTVMYSVLVTSRLLAMRDLMKRVMREYDSSTYDTVALMVVESAMLYIAYAIIFIVSFGMHSNVSNLCFLSISHVQGIAQLLIIIRVARGRAITSEVTRVAAACTTMAFSASVLDETEGINEQTARSVQDGVQLYSVSTTAGETEDGFELHTHEFMDKLLTPDRRKPPDLWNYYQS